MLKKLLILVQLCFYRLLRTFLEGFVRTLDRYMGSDTLENSRVSSHVHGIAFCYLCFLLAETISHVFRCHHGLMDHALGFTTLSRKLRC